MQPVSRRSALLYASTVACLFAALPFSIAFSHLLLFQALLDAMSGVAFGAILLKFEGIAARHSSTMKVLGRDITVR